MLNTKQTVDKHVKTSISKLSEHEKKTRGYSIGKMYFKIGEYNSALNWFSNFLEVQESHADAHKMLGLCYEKLKKPDRALQSYHRSLQLDPKQTNLITDVCKLILSDDTLSSNMNKVKQWCDLAEQRRIQNEAVLNLRLRLAGKTDNRVVEDLLLQEIQQRPTDPGLRIRLVRYLLEENRSAEAFKQCFDIEMKFLPTFGNSLDWYNVVNLACTKYVDFDKDYKSYWNYWLLAVLAIERQLHLQLAADSLLVNANKAQLKDTASILFEFDQLLKKAADIVMSCCPERELAAQFLYHYRGQLLLHIAALIFKIEKVYNRNQWRDATKKTLPLLLLAYQCGTADTEEPWLRKTSEYNRNLLSSWQRQGAFRCAQAGRTILSCISEDQDNSILTQIRHVTNSRSWTSPEDVIQQIQQFCLDVNWRKTIYRALFNTGDQVIKASTSYFVTYDVEPIFELPAGIDVDSYEELALQLDPASLPTQIYLNLGVANISELRLPECSGLNYTVQNLKNCSPDTLNQLDLFSFLCCAVIQTKRTLEAENVYYENFNDKSFDKPRILPFSNMTDVLCSEDQADWWTQVFKICYNTAMAAGSDNLGQLKAVIRNGIEAVRGEGQPKVDLIVMLKLGNALSQRAQNIMKPDEKRALELRAEHIYKVCLQRIKKGPCLSEYRLLFKYSNQNLSAEAVISDLVEEAIQFLASRFFKNSQFTECIDEFDGLDYPFAAYFRSEAYKKLDEGPKTPRRNKQVYLEKSKSSLNDALVLLDDPKYRNHPLHSIVPQEIKRLQYTADPNESLNGFGNNSFIEDERDSISIARNRRSTSFIGGSNPETDTQIKKIVEALDYVKKEFSALHAKVDDIQNRVAKVEELVSKRGTESEDAADLNDLYIIDELNNQANSLQYVDSRATPVQQLQQQQQEMMVRMSQYNQMYNTPYPMCMPQQFANPALQNQMMRSMHGFVSPGQYAGAPADPNSFINDPRASLLMAATQQSTNYYQTPTGVPNTIAQPGTLTRSTFEQALQTPTLLNTWNSTYNSASAMPPATIASVPLAPTAIPAAAAPFASVSDKTPNVVVITNSDPLPPPNSAPIQPKLSVTIPPQHIKNNPAGASGGFAGFGNNVNAGYGSGIESITPPNQPAPITISSSSSQATISHGSIFQGTLQNQLAKPATEQPKSATATPTLFAALTSTPAVTSTTTTVKPLFGGFTGNLTITPTTKSTPAVTSTTSSAATSTTASPFANFTFGKSPEPAKAFGSLFSSAAINQPQSSSAASTLPVKTPEKVKQDADEAPDDFVPSAEFKPVVSLPELKEIVTGEEGETVLFEHRAKLFRYDRDAKEWKERGLGNIKILVSKTDATKIRLLMRREQIHKICCNQYLFKDTKFEKVDKPPSVRWHGPDYSENETQLEFLALRFKTIEIRDNFYIALDEARSKLKGDEEQRANKEKEAAKKSGETKKKDNGKKNESSSEGATGGAVGWGDKFKPKTGSWTCEGCYITNNADALYCVACDSPKDDTVPKKGANNVVTNSSGSTTTFSFGLQPSGQFSFGVGGGGFNFGAKPATTTQSPSSVATTSAATPSTGFSFGTPAKPTVANTTTPPTGFSFANVIASTAASSPQVGFTTPPNPTAAKTSQSSSVTSTPSMNFGSTISTPSSTFSFGTPNKPTTDTVPVPGPVAAKLPMSFVSNSATPSFAELAAQAAAANSSSASSTEFGFNFKLKPRSPGKTKSPCKSPGGASEGEQTDEEYQEEENTAYFTPVVTLAPVDVKTGEEDEEVLYSHRAKLFRWDTDTKEWKERGVGDVKILKHKINDKLRILMRRDQIHKICLNHALSTDIEYTPRDEKNWIFVASDFSEGELEVRSFCLRFKNHEIAMEFKQAADKALKDAGLLIENGHGSEEDREINENKRLSERLSLPTDFFDYKHKDACTGCRGCKDDYQLPVTSTHAVEELPLDMTNVKLTPKRRGSKPKRVSFSIDEPTQSDDKFTAKSIEVKPTVSTNNANQLKSIFSSALNTLEKTPLTSGTSLFAAPSNSGGSIFGGNGGVDKPTTGPSLFGAVQSNTSIFGGTSGQQLFGSKPLFGTGATMNSGSPTAFGSFGAVSAATPSFGSLAGGATGTSATNTTGPPVFGSLSTTNSFSFADAAKDLENKNTPPSATAAENATSSSSNDENKNPSQVPDIMKSNSGLSFADLSKAADPNAFSANKNPNSGFIGLTKSNDVFSKFATKQQKDGNNDNSPDNDDSNANDDNYDPHYEPVLKELPDEIKVSTGEEEETKLFGERAKLYRYSNETKEWKERGVGELKILYHPVRNTYRLVMRREQIHKLVLNQAITSDLSLDPMKTSVNSYLWGGLNHAEGEASLEKLAARFKNAELAQTFKTKIDECVEKVKAKDQGSG